MRGANGVATGLCIFALFIIGNCYTSDFTGAVILLITNILMLTCFWGYNVTRD